MTDFFFLFFSSFFSFRSFLPSFLPSFLLSFLLSFSLSFRYNNLVEEENMTDYGAKEQIKSEIEVQRRSVLMEKSLLSEQVFFFLLFFFLFFFLFSFSFSFSFFFLFLFLLSFFLTVCIEKKLGYVYGDEGCGLCGTNEQPFQLFSRKVRFFSFSLFASSLLFLFS